MRARTHIYIIGVVALALQGCRGGKHPSDPNEEQYAICMAAPTVAGTRALYTDENPLTEFVVYGYKAGNASQMVFTGDEVSKGGDGWIYSPTRYWDRVANYYFAAYAPATAPSGFTYAHDEATRTLALTAPQWQTIDDDVVDLLAATSQDPATTYLRNDGEVELTFDHLYAQLEVQVWVADFIESTYHIRSVSLGDVPRDKDDTNNKVTTSYVIDYDATPAAPTVKAKMADAGEAVSLFSDATGLQADKKTPTATATAATYKYLVVPFTCNDKTNGFKITLGYAIDDNTQEPLTLNTTIKEMKAGQRYVLTLTFSTGNNITPDVTIAEWTPVDVEEDDKYNW